MSVTTEITSKNFTNQLNNWAKGFGSNRQWAQNILEFGFTQYLEHGDAGYLSRTKVKADETKGMNAKLMDSYILAHANVRWNEKSGAYVKAKKGSEPEVSERTCNWWEHNKVQSTEPKAYDLNKRLETLLKQLTEAETVKVDVAAARKTVAEILSEIDTIEIETLESQEQAAEAA